MERDRPEREGQFATGDVCDGYRIISLIAAGGMGDVYEAVHEASGRVVALKCLKVRHRDKQDARARMKMEAIILSELQHANIIQVYDAGVTDLGMVWIAMERLHGQTLRQVLHRAGRVPLADALHYASEIADGVDAVHEVNVIHRDLKPENIFITDRNDVKVLDLGTGKFTGYGMNSTDPMKVIGTTAYMSPEQIKGLGIDARADVYALGLIVYEMIAGRHPLAQSGLAGLPLAPEQMALLQLEAQPPSLEGVAEDCPPYVARIVAQAIAKNRARRTATMMAFCRELRAARKRFIAELGLDDPLARPLAGRERLRDKFGAPPRKGGTPAGRRMSEGSSSTRDRAARVQFADTVIDARRPHLDEQASPAEGTPTATREPTLELSSSSLPAYPPRADGTEQPDPSDPTALPAELQNRTTNTNPVGLLRGAADITPEPHSLLEIPFHPWARARFRRTAVTLGLGALIGIPPAIAGVWWKAHRTVHAAAASDLGTRDIAREAQPVEQPQPVAHAEPSAPNELSSAGADLASSGELAVSPPVRSRAAHMVGRPAGVRSPARAIAANPAAREPGPIGPALAAPVFPIAPAAAPSSVETAAAVAAQAPPGSPTSSGTPAASAGVVSPLGIQLPPSGL